ncbi:MAG: hypothetical protein A2X12_04430 [Bacteroidetes bacterium GWE2_29_8]|nr:MAG: hypothetical protein A2X12_04430 [Bacteroidetes bacterium GWE2_29_8]OFY18599.1 MAG: hypothetical protein A2X02_07430 [Bacteroidetes bacterium GWF2_29_10]
MILVIDSGSTKTEWSIIENNRFISSFRSGGINPYFHNDDYIYNNNINSINQNIDRKVVSEIFFYGAGCSSESKCNIVFKGLARIFENAKIEVYHDLLGAARALCGSKAGIAGILGTGSNSCKYDGVDIVENVKSLGYFFGDEGGGVHIGKTLIIDFLKNNLPIDLRKDFICKYNLSIEDILDSVYNKTNPNKFLASFTLFVKDNINNEYCYDIVEKCFDLYFKEQISQYFEYNKYELNCLGSVAYNFKDILNIVAKKHNVKLGKIIINPNQDLIGYHLNI